MRKIYCIPIKVLYGMFMMFICFTSTIFAQESDMPAKMKTVPVIVSKSYLVMGYFLPKDSDLDGGLLAGAGCKWTSKSETLFINIYFAQTNVNVSNAAVGDVKNYIGEFGYMVDIGVRSRVRVGSGLQFHRMDLGSSRATRVTILGLVEYDISKNITIRAQSSQVVRKNSVRFGGFDLKLLYTP